METNYLKEQFRKDILKEVEEYIGYVYSDDTHFEDKLIVKEFDYSVSHVRCSYKEQKKEYDYFDMSDLIKESGTFTFEADPIGIECVVLHYFPNEKVEKFVKDLETSMLDFVKNHGYSKEAEISFPIDTFEELIDCLSERESVAEEEFEPTEEYFEMELESVSCECRPLRPYVRNTKEKGFVVNERNVRRLAAEMSLEYDFFND